MKKASFILLTVLLAGVLQGCNMFNRDNVSPPTENASVENENSLGQKNVTNNENSLFNFKSFDLDVDYGGKKKVDVDYENESDGMEAEIEDSENNRKLRGNEAFDELKPILEKLTFDKNTPEDEVVNEVLKAFDLNSDFKKFELDIEFNDNTEKEYKVRK